MKQIELLSESASTITFSELSQRLLVLRQSIRLRPLEEDFFNLTDHFSNLLLNDPEARQYPELQVLGFWLRPSSLEKMKNGFVEKQDTIIVPQGLVFHIPPANVDTMFAYSLFVSMLCGNTNIVRMPTKRAHVMLLLLRLLNQSLKASSNEIQKNLLILGYDHDTDITESICNFVDMRVLWGSDTTITTLRQIPLRPFGRELIFSDRFSWSAFNTTAYQALTDAERQCIAEYYYNDLFWFDQAGCASPRIILWCGEPTPTTAHDLYKRLAQIAEQKKWRLDTGASVARQTRNYEAMANLAITAKRDYGSALTVFSLSDLDNIKMIRNNPCFGGTLFQICTNELKDVIHVIERRDQTLTHFGFCKNELESFTHALNGKGFDRIVPVGQALSFEMIWDGYDLPEHFIRRVTLRGGL